MPSIGIGLGIELSARPAVIASGPTLNNLTLSASTVAENTAAGTPIGNIVGLTSGSTWSITDTSSGRFQKVGGGVYTGNSNIDYEATPGYLDIQVTEVKAGYSNRVSTIRITVTNVFEAATLGTLTLSPLTATAGTGYTGTISGKTAGSVVTGTSSDGTTINVSGTTVTCTFTGAGTPTVTLTEALADSSNSGRTSPQSFTVAASGGGGGSTGLTLDNSDPDNSQNFFFLLAA